MSKVPAIVGLTGLIGSGKSTVAALFAEHGVLVHDTDILAHKLTQIRGVALPQIAAEFGSAVFNLDNSLNRKLLAELVFNNDKLRERLEGILHPLIFAELKLAIKVGATAGVNFAETAPYQIVMVPLLFRSPLFLSLTRRNIFVDCAYAQLVERVQLRSGLSRQQIDAILVQQVDRKIQLNLADDIIYNHDAPDALASQVELLHKKYLRILC